MGTEENGEHVVVVVGAGVCGLATALAVAQRGCRAIVLEKRLDPFAEDGRRAVAEGDQYLIAANRLMERGTDPQMAFDEVRRLRALHWGGRMRNIFLDVPSLQFMKALGVDISTLPMMEVMDVFFGDDLPRIVFRCAERTIDADAGCLDSDRLMTQRDWAAQATIGQLEGALRAAVEAQAGIDLRFGTEVHMCREHEHGIDVSFDADGRGDVVTGDLVVVADGGGEASLSRRLGIGRRFISEDLVAYSVFAASGDDHIHGFDGDRVFASAGVTGSGLGIGVAGNGQTLAVGVNARLADGADARSSYEHTRREGVAADLVDPPFEVACPIDHAQEYTLGTRLVLAGDSISRGSPTFGVGVQFGLFWAQMVADTLVAGELSDPERKSAVDRYRQAASSITEKRLSFEQAWLDVFDQSVTGRRPLLEVMTSEDALSAMRDMQLRFRTEGDEATCRFRLQIDFRTAVPDRAKPEIAVLKNLGDVSVEGSLRFRRTAETSSASISSEEPLTFVTATEKVVIGQGEITFGRSADGWAILVRDALAVRTPYQTGVAFDMPIKELSIDVPDRFMETLVQRLPDRLAALGLIDSAPVCLDLDFNEGQLIDWGSFRVRLDGRPRVRLVLSKSRRGTPRMVLSVTRGSAVPVEFSRFARRTGIGSARAIRSFSRATAGWFDGAIDYWASFWGGLVKKVEFDLLNDGSAVATYHLLSPFTFRLSSADMRQIRKELFSTRVIADLMPQYERAVRRGTFSRGTTSRRRRGRAT